MKNFSLNVIVILMIGLMFVLATGCSNSDNDNSGGDTAIDQPAGGEDEQPSGGEDDQPSEGGGDQPADGGNDQPSEGGGDQPADGGDDQPSEGGGDTGGNTDQPPTVYMTREITPESLVTIYQRLGRTASGNVAVKMHMGEAGNINYLKPELVRNLVQSVNGTLVETNTAYGGARASTAMHLQTAADHGFTAIANIDIMDADGYMSLPVTGGIHLNENRVGANLANYDFVIILSHFKGHDMAGFGGAIKNMTIGLAASVGKSLIHSAGEDETGFGWFTPAALFEESMADAAKSVVDYEGENIVYINVMNVLSVDCDCMAHAAPASMADIGVLASLDPVALDQACVDLVYAAPDGAELIERIESRDGVHVLEACEQIGVGSRTYQLVNIDG